MRGSQNVIDYNTKHGQVIYSKNTETLPICDLSGDGLAGFLQNTKDRSSEARWTTTLMVPCTDGQIRDFFEQHGTITLDEIKDHTALYIGLHTWNAQNSYQMAVCFKKTLTDEAKLTVESTPSNYTVNGQVDGVAYLKTIIMNSIVDTRFTTMTIREKLQALPAHMIALDNNITSFNNDV